MRSIQSFSLKFVQFFLFFLGISIVVYSAAEAADKKHHEKAGISSKFFNAKPAPLPSADCFCFNDDLEPTVDSIMLSAMDASADAECLKYGKQKGISCEYDPNLSPGYVSLSDAPGF